MKKNIITYGAILGIIFAVAGFLYFKAMIGMAMSSILTFGGLIVILFLAGIQYRKSQDGFASFGELLKLFVGISLVALFFSIVSSVTHISLMDEDAKIEFTDKMVNSQLSMYKSMGMNDEMIDEMEDDFREEMTNVLTPSTMITGSLLNFLIYFLISLIPAGILKRS